MEWASHRQERFFANYPNVRNRKKEEEICSAFNVAVCRVQMAQRPSMPHSIVHRVRKEDSFVGKEELEGRYLYDINTGKGSEVRGEGSAQISDIFRKLRNNRKDGCMKMQICLHLTTLYLVREGGKKIQTSCKCHLRMALMVLSGKIYLWVCSSMSKTPFSRGDPRMQREKRKLMVKQKRREEERQ